MPWHFDKATRTLHLKTNKVDAFKDRAKDADTLNPHHAHMGTYEKTVIVASDAKGQGQVFYIVPQQNQLTFAEDEVRVVLPENHEIIGFLAQENTPQNLYFVVAGYNTQKLQNDKEESLNFALTANQVLLAAGSTENPNKMTLTIDNPTIQGMGFKGGELKPVDLPLTLEAFANAWGEDETTHKRKSFSLNPPTTFLKGQTAEGQSHQYVMTITHPSIEGDVITFEATLTHLNGKAVEAAQPVTLENAIVFVDACSGSHCFPDR